MRHKSANSGTSFLRVFRIFLSLAFASSAWCYDSYLSEQDIRDAYFLGAREGGLTAQFRARYSRWVSELRQGNCISEIRLETPFLRVADFTSKVPNYSAQATVKDFYDKPMKFRVFLDICYMREAPPPNSVRIKVVQNNKEIVPVSEARLFYAEPAGALGVLPPNGEKVQLEFGAQKIDSSTLSFLIDTPDGQRATVDLNLLSVR